MRWLIIKTKNTSNRLILFWKIGKSAFEEQERVDNVTDKYSNYFQYKYGMSECFSRENINLMRKLYLCFPIFTDNLLKLEWGHYLELLKISDKKRRMFYYQLALFFNWSIFELVYSINNYFYERI